jgi:hypothetical protein
MSKGMVRFHRLAAVEYKAALAWYRIRSNKAAGEFRDEMRRVIQQLEADPHWRILFRGAYRWTRLRRFPYLLYYKTVAPDTITIYAVAHARRRLGYWLRRT